MESLQIQNVTLLYVNPFLATQMNGNKAKLSTKYN